MMVLFVNACVREESRTKELADYLLSERNDPYMEVSQIGKKQDR